MSIWQSFKQAVGLVPKRAGDGGGSRIITLPPLYQQFMRIGGGLTPQDVSDIIRSADCGQVWRLIDLGNESRQKDTHLQSVLYTREIAISSLPIKVIDPEDATGAEKEAAQLCREVCEQASGGRDGSVGLRPTIAHMQRGNYFGFSVAETDWQLQRRRLVPAGFWTTPHRLFAFDGYDGKLKWAPLGAGQAFDLVDLLEEFPARFIQHQPTVNGDVAAREGLLRVLMWAALFRNWTLRDWLTLAEIGWKPWRIGTFKTGASASDRRNLENMMQALTTTGTAVKSDNQEIEIFWPENQTSQSGKSAHNELHTMLGEGMSKAVLGQTLTTEASSRGTQALGKVQDLVRQDIKRADAMAVSATLMRDLFSKVVRFNFGNDVRLPAVLLVSDEGVDRLSFAQAVQALSNAGCRLSAKWVRSEFGAPEPLDDEELLIPITVVEPQSGNDNDDEPNDKARKKVA